MVIPVATNRKSFEAYFLPWLKSLTVWHAISIAITVVMPEPATSFSARRSSSGLDATFAASRRVQNRLHYAPPCRAPCGA